MSLIILHLTSLLQRRGWETGMIFVKVASDSHIFFIYIKYQTHILKCLFISLQSFHMKIDECRALLCQLPDG